MNLLTEFDQEQYDRIRRREGYEEGVVSGAQQKAIEAATNLLKMNKLSPEENADPQELPSDQTRELQKSIIV